MREVGLARPADRPEAIRPLLALGLGEIDAGFGIEVIRLEATETETVTARQHRGQLAVTAATGERGARESDGLADLLGRLGARLGLEALLRLHPAESHLPEKAATEMAAAFTVPAGGWPPAPAPRPILLFAPEPIATDDLRPPGTFVWRRRARRRTAAFGPERIAPEWWLDAPAWRSGPARLLAHRDRGGHAPVGLRGPGRRDSTGWFAHGLFP